jgi:aromatic ring-cleaving dioxygenase
MQTRPTTAPGSRFTPLHRREHTHPSMTLLTTSQIQTWHAHVYFDAATRDAAWQFREEIAAHFGDALQLGRFHEKPVGPHPKWSYQLAFERAQFADIVEWLTLNHGVLDVFLHPNTGDSLRDHRDAAVWIGHSHNLVLDIFTA